MLCSRWSDEHVLTTVIANVSSAYLPAKLRNMMLSLSLRMSTLEEWMLDTPIFLGQITNDEVIDIDLGRQMRDSLKRARA